MARGAAAEDTSAVYAVTHAGSDTAKAAAATSAPVNTTAAAVNDTHIARDMQGERRTTTAAAAALMVQATTADGTRVKSGAEPSGLQNIKQYFRTYSTNYNN